jgi:hypothetical protein
LHLLRDLLWAVEATDTCSGHFPHNSHDFVIQIANTVQSIVLKCEGGTSATSLWVQSSDSRRLCIRCQH